MHGGGVGHHHRDRPKLVYRYSRLNLNYDEYGMLEGRPVLRGSRSVSMFWMEKLNLLILFFQIHGAIWVMSDERWNWPYDFILYSRWTMLFTLDWFSLASFGGRNSTASWYNNHYHSWLILALPVATMAVYNILKYTVYADSLDDRAAVDVDDSNIEDDDDDADEGDGTGSIKPTAADMTEQKQLLSKANRSDRKRVVAAKERQKAAHAHSFGDEFEQTHPWMSYLFFIRLFTLINEWLYIPLLIVAFRVWICDSATDSVIYIDSGMKCWSNSHLTLLIVAMGIAAVWVIAFPALMFYRTRKLLVFSNSGAVSSDSGSHAAGHSSSAARGGSGSAAANDEDPSGGGFAGVMSSTGDSQHERYVQSREIEYLLGVNTLYESLHFHLIGNYRRAWAYSRFHLCIQKVLVVFIVYGLGPYAVNPTPEVQAICFFVIIALYPVLKLYETQFRTPHTNQIRFCLDWTMVINALIGIFSSANFRSALLVATNLQRILFSFNFVGFALGGLIAGWTLYKKHHWPITTTVVEEIYLGNESVVKGLNLAKRLLENAQNCPHEFFPLHHIEETIIEMRTVINALRQSAEEEAAGKSKHKGAGDAGSGGGGGGGGGAKVGPRGVSVDEWRRKRGARYARVLEWTLIDMMEDLADIHNTASMHSPFTRLSGAPAGTGGTSAAVAQAAIVAEQKRYDRMQRALTGLTVALERRRIERQMMKPAKRRALNKLLILRALLGDEFIYNIARPDWIIPLTDSEKARHAAAQAPHGGHHHHHHAQSHGGGGGGGGKPGTSAAITDEAKLKHEAEDAVGQLTPAPPMSARDRGGDRSGAADRSGGVEMGLVTGSMRTRRRTPVADGQSSAGGSSGSNGGGDAFGRALQRGGNGSQPGSASGLLGRRSKTFQSPPVLQPAASGGGGPATAPIAEDAPLSAGPTGSSQPLLSATPARPAPPSPGVLPATPSGVNVAMRPTPAIQRGLSARGMSGRNLRIDAGLAAGRPTAGSVEMGAVAGTGAGAAKYDDGPAPL